MKVDSAKQYLQGFQIQEKNYSDKQFLDQISVPIKHAPTNQEAPVPYSSLLPDQRRRRESEPDRT